MAILLRSVRRDGGAVIEALEAAGVPYIIPGLDNLLEKEEVIAARELFYFMAEESDAATLRDVWRQADLGMELEALDRAIEVLLPSGSVPLYTAEGASGRGRPGSGVIQA